MFCGLALFWIYEKRYKLSIEVLGHSRIFISLCVFFSFLIISLLYTENISTWSKAVEKKSGLIILPILLTGIHWDNNLRKDVFRLFVASVFCLTIYSFVTTLIRPDIDLSDMAYFSWVLPESSSLTSNYYSLFLTFAILILIFEFRMFHASIAKPVLILVIIYLAVFLALLASRTAIAGTILILLFFATHKVLSQNKRERGKGIIIILLTVSLSIGLVMSIPYLNNRFRQSVFHFANDPRHLLFKDNISVFLKNPIFGVGIGDVQDELVKEHLTSGNMEAYTRKYNAHNDWFQILIAAGLVGFALFAYLYYEMIRMAWSKKERYMISFLIYFTLISMTESILERNKGVIFFSFFLTMFFILKVQELSPRSSTPKVPPAY